MTVELFSEKIRKKTAQLLRKEEEEQISVAEVITVLFLASYRSRVSAEGAANTINSYCSNTKIKAQRIGAIFAKYIRSGQPSLTLSVSPTGELVGYIVDNFGNVVEEEVYLPEGEINPLQELRGIVDKIFAGTLSKHDVITVQIPQYGYVRYSATFSPPDKYSLAIRRVLSHKDKNAYTLVLSSGSLDKNIIEILSTYMALTTRWGLLTLGAPSSGKTTTTNALLQAMIKKYEHFKVKRPPLWVVTGRFPEYPSELKAATPGEEDDWTVRSNTVATYVSEITPHNAQKVSDLLTSMSYQVATSHGDIHTFNTRIGRALGIEDSPGKLISHHLGFTLCLYNKTLTVVDNNEAKIRPITASGWVAALPEDPAKKSMRCLFVYQQDKGFVLTEDEWVLRAITQNMPRNVANDLIKMTYSIENKGDLRAYDLD